MRRCVTIEGFERFNWLAPAHVSSRNPLIRFNCLPITV